MIAGLRFLLVQQTMMFGLCRRLSRQYCWWQRRLEGDRHFVKSKQRAALKFLMRAFNLVATR